MLTSITVAVCTWNPPPVAQRCVAAAAETVGRAAVPASLLVIDNGRAGTRAASGVSESVPVRIVKEQRLGLAHARNRALAEADGEAVAFFDDDIEPAPGWLNAHISAYERSSVVCVGGPVRLRWPPAGPPRWYTPAFASFFCGIDHGGAARVVGRSELPMGANFSVRRDAALAVGGFSTDLGRAGPSLRSGEDTDFGRRLLARFPAGICYEPAALVCHHVRPERRRPSWVIRRAAAAGSSEALLLALEDRLDTLTPRRLLRVRYARSGDLLTTRCVDIGIRVALAFGYWRARRA